MKSNHTVPSPENRSIPPLESDSLEILYQRAMVGSLVPGLIHEILNPLGYTRANLGALKRYTAMITAFLGELEASGSARLEEPETLHSLMETHNIDFILEDLPDLGSQSEEGTGRIHGLLVALGSMITSPDEAMTTVDLQGVVESALCLARNRLKRRMRVRKNIPHLPAIPGQPGQLGLVVLSLLLNSTDAVEARSADSKGRITLSAEPGAENVLLRITDNGCGIAPGDLNSIFDPCFSTWKSRQGLGLGLTFARRILDRHGGEITVESTRDVGTTITLRLPLEQARKDSP